MGRRDSPALKNLPKETPPGAHPYSGLWDPQFLLTYYFARSIAQRILRGEPVGLRPRHFSPVPIPTENDIASGTLVRTAVCYVPINSAKWRMLLFIYNKRNIFIKKAFNDRTSLYFSTCTRHEKTCGSKNKGCCEPSAPTTCNTLVVERTT